MSSLVDNVVATIRTGESVSWAGQPLSGVAEALVERAAPLAGDEERRNIVRDVLAAVVGLGPLQRQLDDDTVTDVMVNSDGRVWVERGGHLEPTTTVVEPLDRQDLIDRVLGAAGVTVDRSHPVADACLADGSRISVVVPPVSPDGPVIAIRRISTRRVELAAFGGAEVAAVLEELVARRANLVIHGPTGSGKTTLLGAIARLAGPTERMVIIEDTRELTVEGHVVRLETRRPNNEGIGEVTMRDLVRAAMRLRPDRILVGEVRGAEALDMVWALSTGHTGCCSTVHARSPGDALTRLELFCLLADAQLPAGVARAQVRSAIDAVVTVGRGVDGQRRVVAVNEVCPERGIGEPLLGPCAAVVPSAGGDPL